MSDTRTPLVRRGMELVVFRVLTLAVTIALARLALKILAEAEAADPKHVFARERVRFAAENFKAQLREGPQIRIEEETGGLAECDP